MREGQWVEGSGAVWRETASGERWAHREQGAGRTGPVEQWVGSGRRSTPQLSESHGRAS